jgi:hypothetical protein
LLVAAERDKTDIAIPWLVGKRLRSIFGRPRFVRRPSVLYS